VLFWDSEGIITLCLKMVSDNVVDASESLTWWVLGIEFDIFDRRSIKNQLTSSMKLLL
jgi:hypothetical protein